MYSFVRNSWRYCLIGKLAIVLLCTGCAGGNRLSTQGIFEKDYIDSLPSPLRNSQVQFDQVLNAYDNLNDRQKAAALEHFLGQKYLVADEQLQAAYMLAKVYQKNIEVDKSEQKGLLSKQECKQAIALFNVAKKYPPLKLLSLWHMIGVATISGDEKLIRRTFDEMLSEKPSSVDIAAIQYGLAQSYLRTYENTRAVSILEKIRLDFPHTDYALGAGYYLATLDYSQFDIDTKSADRFKQDRVKTEISSSFKTILPYYLEYLQLSPEGRFAKDILAKIKNLEDKYNLHLKEDELAIIANAYFANGSLASALNYFQKANAGKHSFEIAECLIKQERAGAAQPYFFKAVETYPSDKRCFSVALLISDRLTKAEALKLWTKLRNKKVAGQDQIVWNIAIREPLPRALVLYQELLRLYPASIYAPEVQWRLLWQKYKTTPAYSRRLLSELFSKAASKYNQSKLAPRFIYWAAKSMQAAGNKQQSTVYYEKACAEYGNDYYGQRSKAQLATLRGINDDYFDLQQPLAINSRGQNYPYPEKAMQEVQSKHEDTLFTLMHLKQYDEALTESKNAPADLISWLLAKNDQPLLAINTAAKQTQEESHIQKTSPQFNKSITWQYAYPLLYNEQISADCKGSSISDPLLMQALIREESRYNPYAISQSKALGLCQLMPGTASGVAKNIGVTMKTNNDLFQPDLNIKLGTAYLSSVLRTFQGNSLMAIASYNAGVNAVKGRMQDKEKFVIKDPDFFVEDFPYRETRDYIRKVFNSYWLYREIYN